MEFMFMFVYCIVNTQIRHIIQFQNKTRGNVVAHFMKIVICCYLYATYYIFNEVEQYVSGRYQVFYKYHVFYIARLSFLPEDQVTILST